MKRHSNLMQQPEDLDIIKMIVMKQKSFIFYLGSAEEKEEGSK